MAAADETLMLVNAYRDGELSPLEALDMERKLAADPALRAMADRLEGLSSALRKTLAEVPVPDRLRGRVTEHLGLADTTTSRVRSWPLSWQSLAAALVVGLSAGGLMGGGSVYLALRGVSQTASDAVLAGHLRSLAAPQPFDIASSDRHVVKPWFNGRTTIAPSAPDLADKGFPLVGGRIDVVDGKSVPSLVYRHDRHVISVTIVPKTIVTPTREEQRDGSTLEAWNAGDLTYWAVSDLNARDLRNFADLFRARVAQER